MKRTYEERLKNLPSWDENTGRMTIEAWWGCQKCSDLRPQDETTCKTCGTERGKDDEERKRK